MDCFVVSLLAMTKKQKTVPPTPSLRGFEKAVAISGWDTMTVKQNSSLREPKVRGNLSMGYNFIYSWNSFSFCFYIYFLWLVGVCLPLYVFIFTFCGLWGFASLCKGGSCEATGGLREKLKMEN